MPGEVERALASCLALAQGRLFPGSRLAAGQPRYARGSLSPPSPARPIERNMSRLLSTLEDRCGDTWWLGGLEQIELASGETLVLDVAGWQKGRFPSDPRTTVNPPPADPDPALYPPEWACNRVTWFTPTEALERTSALCARAGIPWYWLIDMQSRVVSVLQLTGDAYRLQFDVPSTHRVALPPFDCLELDLAPLFQET
jgi:hypothetical protein